MLQWGAGEAQAVFAALPLPPDLGTGSAPVTQPVSWEEGARKGCWRLPSS